MSLSTGCENEKNTSVQIDNQQIAECKQVQTLIHSPDAAGKQGHVIEMAGHYEKVLEMIAQINNVSVSRAKTLLAEIQWAQVEEKAKKFFGPLDEKSKRAQLAMLRILAKVASEQGQLDKATKHCEKALAICAQVGDSARQAQTLFQLGGLAQEQGQLGKAKQHYEKALELFAKLGDEREQAKTLYALGSLAHKEGQFDKAFTHCEKAMKMFAKLEDDDEDDEVVVKLGQANMHCLLASLAQDQHQWSKELENFDGALYVFERRNDVHGQAYLLICLAELEGVVLQRWMRALQCCWRLQQIVERFPELDAEFGSRIVRLLRLLYINGNDACRACIDERLADDPAMLASMQGRVDKE